MNDLRKVADFMERLARKAEKMMKQNYSVIDKGIRDVVTGNDLAIEKYCIKEIYAKFPNASIISEELNSEKTLGEQTFVIDPIDGTKNYSHGLDEFGFQIAYAENGVVQASVIILPKLDIFIKAIRGVGVFNNGKKVTVKPCDLAHSLWLVEGREYKYYMMHALDGISQGARRIGCISAMFGSLIAGRVDGIFNGKAHYWDYLAGLFACECAGFKYVITDSGEQIIASSEELVKSALKEFKKIKKQKEKSCVTK